MKYTIIRLAAISALLLMTGCAQMMMGQPKPTIETTQHLRAAALPPAAVGSFTIDTRLDPAMDKHISVRGANSLSAPSGGSFAQYLRETLVVELNAAGLLDANSDISISGTLLDSQLDPAIGTGTASLSARFVVNRNGQERYKRELTAKASWESSFIGAVAIPLAAGQYEGLYRKLVSQLVDDEAFRLALKN